MLNNNHCSKTLRYRRIDLDDIVFTEEKEIYNLGLILNGTIS